MFADPAKSEIFNEIINDPYILPKYKTDKPNKLEMAKFLSLLNY